MICVQIIFEKTGALLTYFIFLFFYSPRFLSPQLFPRLCFNFSLDCEDVVLEEGTDPCVYYTQLTKLLNLIALLGIIIPFCGNLTLFFNLCRLFLL